MSGNKLNSIPPITNPQGSDEEMLSELHSNTLDYFLKEMNPDNGLIPDSTKPNSPCSIAAVGLSLSGYTVASERGTLPRREALRRTLKVLRFFSNSEQSDAKTATGYKGFYYHFIDMKTGQRAWQSELSTIDTALLLAGVLSSVTYFKNNEPLENEVRELGEELYRRADWRWALASGTSLSHGWMPESGFLPYRWDHGYSEAMILYVLAMGSPTFAIDPAYYKQWITTFELKTFYGESYIYAGPLFIHQLSHIWIDFRGIRDACNRRFNLDYFENSRRATHVQRSYAVENPGGFAHYSKNCWGITASNGPGPIRLKVDGRDREFYGYLARGAPLGPDDGTIAPWAVVSSLPFAPEIVLSTLRHAIERLRLKRSNAYGLDASFNATYPEVGLNPNGWVAPWQLGLNEGPIILMIENHQTEFVWKLMRQCPYISKGLMAGGFAGGWLDTSSRS